MKKRFLSLILSLALLISVALPMMAIDVNAAATHYWPVPGHTSLSRGFSADHKALDIHDSSINGATVIAAMGGTVSRIYLCPQQHYGDYHDCNGFGTGLVILGDDGCYYQYAHMQANSIPSNVYYGAYVQAGQVIGRVGTTGNSTGPHLHFSIASPSANWWEPDINPGTLSYNYTTPGTQYEDLGECFFAYIKFAGTGHGVCNVDSNVQLGTYKEETSLWYFVRQSDMSYKINSAVDGNMMDVYNGGTADETNIWTYPNNDTIAQRFFIQKANNGYNLIAANSGKALDARDGTNSTVGSNIHLFTQNGSIDQVFQFEIPSWFTFYGYKYYHIGGVLVTGWRQIDGKWYYFDGDGAMCTDWIKISNNWYYLGDNGVMRTGWVKDGSSWYYMNRSGAMVTGTQTIEGKQHKFSNSGVWLGEVSQNGWVSSGGKWYYYRNGAMVTGWSKIDGTYYYFNASGVMQTGWLKSGSAWYYLQSSGAMATGWLKVGGTYYYFNSSGAMQTGWLKSGSTWYYLQSSGAMATGWLKNGSNWYYLNTSGAMQTGWQKIGGTWYYFHSSGAMATGSVNIGGTVYKFSSSGAWLG